MKRILLLTLVMFSACFVNAEEPKSEIQLVYFHMNRRCANCIAIENEAKNALEQNFSDELNSGKIKFITVNFEENENPELISKLNIKGKALYAVKGDKKVNLTNKAFLYARSKPEKYHSVIEKAIKGL